MSCFLLYSLDGASIGGRRRDAVRLRGRTAMLGPSWKRCLYQSRPGALRRQRRPTRRASCVNVPSPILHSPVEGKDGWGQVAGPHVVWMRPARSVSLELIDVAVERGWPVPRACQPLGVNETRRVVHGPRQARRARRPDARRQSPVQH